MSSVNNYPICKDHEKERNFFCVEHTVWFCEACLKGHKKCKGGYLRYEEVIEKIEGENLKQVHVDLQKIANELTNQLSRTKNEFINKIDDYLNSLHKSLNLNIDYANKNQLELAMQCYRYKQSNDQLEYDYFYDNLVEFIKDLEMSKNNFLNYKIIKEQEGFITQYNIQLLRDWIGLPKMNVELVFKATRDGFNAMEFISKVQNVAPNIIVAKTDFGKLIGGYSTQDWRVGVKDYEEKGDDTGKTFIFSFDLKQKFEPKDKRFSISYSRNSGPIFGCKYTKQYGPLLSSSFEPDFEIVSEPNKNKCKYSNVGKCYNFSFTKEDFFGTDGSFFIEDYELYRIV